MQAAPASHHRQCARVLPGRGCALSLPVYGLPFVGFSFLGFSGLTVSLGYRVKRRTHSYLYRRLSCKLQWASRPSASAIQAEVPWVLCLKAWASVLRRAAEGCDAPAPHKSTRASSTHTKIMDEGLAAQLLSIGCAASSELRVGAGKPGLGLDGAPLGALGGLLAEMLPSGESFRRGNGSPPGAPWFAPVAKASPGQNPSMEPYAQASPGASPQAGARRSPWDSFSSLASAGGPAGFPAGGARALPQAKAAADGAPAGAPPALPPLLQADSNTKHAATLGCGDLGAADTPMKGRPAANGAGAHADQDGTAGRCGRHGRLLGSAACGCGLGNAMPRTISASSSCSSFVTAGSDSDDDEFEEAPDAGLSSLSAAGGLTLTEHLSAAIAELAALGGTSGETPPSLTPTLSLSEPALFPATPTLALAQGAGNFTKPDSGPPQAVALGVLPASELRPAAVLGAAQTCAYMTGAGRRCIDCM